MHKIILILALLGISGCALGLGGGLGVSVDTRGSFTVLLSLHANNLGLRVEPDKTPRTEQATYLNPMELAGGVRFGGDRPTAGIMRLEIAGVAFSQDELDDGWGGNLGLAFRTDFAWPLDGSKSSYGVGGVLKGAVLHHLDVTKLKRLESRPEWPDGWKLHRIGPGASVAVMHDDEGWYGQLTLMMLYEYLTYFTVGL